MQDVREDEVAERPVDDNDVAGTGEVDADALLNVSEGKRRHRSLSLSICLFVFLTFKTPHSCLRCVVFGARC